MTLRDFGHMRLILPAAGVSAVVASAVLFTGCGPDQQTDDSAFSAAVQGIWSDAEIGTDGAYGSLFRQGTHAIAPRDIRELLMNWPGKMSLRKWPNEWKFHCARGRVVFWGDGEIGNSFSPDEASDRFEAALRKLGYSEVSDDTTREKLKSRLGLPPDDFDRWGDSAWFTRQAGETECTVIRGLAASYSGGDGSVPSGLEYGWFVTRPYTESQPTLADVLSVLPKWCRVSWLDASVYEALVEEPVIASVNGRGMSITFASVVGPKVQAVLEDTGFAFSKEYEPYRDGGVQKSWQRYADSTYAHITTYPGESQTRFSCQAPQRKGEPRTGKAPYMYPSRRLPMSKRPVVDFDQLVFASPELKEQTRILHELGDRAAKDDWIVHQYRDERHSNAPALVARWCTDLAPGNPILASLLPHHSLSVTLNGPATTEGNDDRLESAKVEAKWIPQEGWAAWVQCRLNGDSEPKLSEFFAHVSPPQPGSSHFGFRMNGSTPGIDLLNHAVEVQYGREFSTNYRASILNPDRQWPDEAERLLRLRSLYESPERLREVLLADVEYMRQLSGEQIPQGINIRVSHRQHRSYHEPTPDVPGARPDDATVKQLLDLMSAALDTREALIRNNHQEIHAALVGTLPIDALVRSE